MAHIQIRNVPEDVHLKLKARAAESGLSLSDYLLRELQPLADLPTLEEWARRVRKRPRVKLRTDPVEVLRVARAERG